MQQHAAQPNHKAPDSKLKALIIDAKTTIMSGPNHHATMMRITRPRQTLK
ncbi:MAG: hypothetical protein R3B93_24420 [Bacteroidia bacterium]